MDVQDVDVRNSVLLECLRPLSVDDGPVTAVLDTDTFNEVDDQFALVYALLSPQRITLEACYAAPFHNKRSSGPADGMERSYQEILRLLELMHRPGEGLALRGSTSFLPNADVPVRSEAAEDLVHRALASRDRPLYVMAIGAPTNVASAILMEPAIIERIVVVWLGGQPYGWRSAREFNLRQDMHASRVLFDSGVPLVHVPCTNVAEHLRTTGPELEEQIGEAGALGRDLTRLVREHIEAGSGLSKVLWDIAAIAWLINPKWVPTALEPSPVLTDQCTWSRDVTRHLVRVAQHVKRDAVFDDFFAKVREFAE